MDKNICNFEIFHEKVQKYANRAGVIITESASNWMANDALFLIKNVVQDGIKLMRHCKRERLLETDIMGALKIRNFHPLFALPVCASGYVQSKVILKEILEGSSTMDEEATLHSHWLSVRGNQPTIPENPCFMNVSLQKIDAVNPKAIYMRYEAGELVSMPYERETRLIVNAERVLVKELAYHDMSLEQQKYFIKVLSACLGRSERKRFGALRKLASSPLLYEMLPALCSLISDGVRFHVAHRNGGHLSYLMRMIHALHVNPNVYLGKFLHQLIPSIITCAVTAQVCRSPRTQNHWALRDFAAKLLGKICRTYDSECNEIRDRAANVLRRPIEDEEMPLSSLYGALKALQELGSRYYRKIIFPMAKSIGDRIERVTKGLDKVAVPHIRPLLVKGLAPIIMRKRHPPDFIEEFEADFGLLGPAFHFAVCMERRSLESSSKRSLTKHQSFMSKINVTDTEMNHNNQVDHKQLSECKTSQIDFTNLSGFSEITAFAQSPNHF